MGTIYNIGNSLSLCITNSQAYYTQLKYIQFAKVQGLLSVIMQEYTQLNFLQSKYPPLRFYRRALHRHKPIVKFFKHQHWLYFFLLEV